jgi:O-glycosyl hydrolase
MRAIRAMSAFLLLTAVGALATITIDEASEYQTIDGFGVLVSEWNMAEHNDQALINTLVQDLGVSIMRFLAILQFESANENSDAESLDLSRFNVGGDFGTQMAIIEKFKAAASGDLLIDKYFVSPLSPPAFMKTNNNVVGGALRTDMYQEYAEHLAAYCKAVKQATGVDLYSISLENEPEWEQWYASCVVTPTEMRDLMRVVGPRFEREGLSGVKLMWAETLASSQIWGQYLAQVIRDTVGGGPFGGIYAVHSYLDGVNPSDPGAQRWTQIRTAVNTLPGLPLWMSETSGYDNTWDGAMSMARAIYSALKYGQVEAWVWHSPNATQDGHIQEALMYNGQPKVHYYIAKQFYRWIRPGAVMIGAQSTDSVAVVAFRHTQDQTLTVVCINESAQPVTTTLAGNTLPAFNAYRTTATDRCIPAGPVQGSITLQPSSVTTLVGAGWNPVVAVRARPATRAAAAQAATWKVVTLTGKIVNKDASANAGLYLSIGNGQVRRVVTIPVGQHVTRSLRQ